VNAVAEVEALGVAFVSLSEKVAVSTRDFNLGIVPPHSAAAIHFPAGSVL
jgi:hypothetical protein